MRKKRPQKRPNRRQQPDSRRISDQEPPFDAEAHYRDYDHEAVRDLSARTVICPATFNRKSTVEACVGATFQHRIDAKLYLHDDGSDDYDEEWLQQFADRVKVHKHGFGGKRGVKDLRSNIVKGLLDEGNVEHDEWVPQDFPDGKLEYLYMVDSDGYHDPHFFYRIHEIMNIHPNWGCICLYNAKFHSPRGGRRENNIIAPDLVVRGMSAGISMFFRLQSFRDKPSSIQVPDGRGWDGFYSREIAGRKVVTSLTSYVEHYGKWGFHNKGSWDRDRAVNPTAHLASTRDAAIKQIESGAKKK